MIRLASAHCFVIPAKGEFLLQIQGLPPQELAADISRMTDDVRHAELEEDHHTRLRYLSWSEKVDDKWVRQTVVLHAGETHPILEVRKSVAEHSRLA